MPLFLFIKNQSNINLFTKTLVVTNITGSTLTDMSIPFVLDTSALISSEEMADDGGIQVKTLDGNLIPYWKEGSTPSAATQYWFKAAVLPPGDTSFKVFFSRQEVFPTYFQKENVFDFFDDFDGSELNPQWTNTLGTINISDGQLQIGSLGVMDGIFAGGFPVPHDRVIESLANILGQSYGSVVRLATNTSTAYVPDGGAGVVDILLYGASIYSEVSSGAEASMAVLNYAGVDIKYRIDYRPNGTTNVKFDYNSGATVANMTDASAAGTLYPAISTRSAEATRIPNTYVKWFRIYKYFTGKITVEVTT